MEILLDTLNKMDIESQIKEKIQEKLNFSKKIQDKET